MEGVLTQVMALNIGAALWLAASGEGLLRRRPDGLSGSGDATTYRSEVMMSPGSMSATYRRFIYSSGGAFGPLALRGGTGDVSLFPAHVMCDCMAWCWLHSGLRAAGEGLLAGDRGVSGDCWHVPVQGMVVMAPWSFSIIPPKTCEDHIYLLVRSPVNIH